MTVPVGILSTAHGRGTGAFIVLEHLLQGWHDERLEPWVIAPVDSHVGELTAELGFPFIALGSTRDRFVDHMRFCLSDLEALRPCRIIHAWHSRGFELAWIIGKRIGIPALGTIHDHPHCATHGPLRRTLVRLSARGLRRLACVSEAVRTAWTPVCGGETLRVIHNGLIDTQVTPRMGRCMPPTIGFLGMYAAWKGFAVVEQWVRETGDLQASWNLYGDIDDELHETANRLARDAKGRVRLCGRQAPEEIFRDIDILVHASLEFDPFPTVLLEASRAGVPALASSLGGAGEIVEDGQTGYLFSPSEPAGGLAHLRAMVSDDALRTRLGRAARERFEQEFGVSAMVDGYKRFWTGSLES